MAGRSDFDLPLIVDEDVHDLRLREWGDLSSGSKVEKPDGGRKSAGRKVVWESG